MASRRIRHTVPQVLLILTMLHAAALFGHAQSAPAAKLPQSTGETVIIGATALRIGMSKDDVISALGMQYNLLAWPDMLAPASRYSVLEGKSNLVGIVTFDGGYLTEVEKDWNPNDRHYSDGEVGRVLVTVFTHLVNEGKETCSIVISRPPPVSQNGQGPRIMVRDVGIKCGRKLIRISTTTEDGVDSLAITEEISSLY